LLDSHEAIGSGEFLAGAAPLPERTSLAGLQVGDYTLRAPLGHGGMGHVWLAERSDGRFEGKAAVKLLNASLIGRDAEARFKREGDLLARLRHPCIAPLIDAGMTAMGQPYLVLEHVDGEPIDRYCDARRLTVEARIRLFLDVLSAVAFAHANLVVHRDLKPPNILVGKDGRVRLLDFGIAKLLESEGGRDAGAPLTREGESVLTPEYAAPEQLQRGTITTATDVYALGVVLYVLLTGKHPAGEYAASPVDLIRAVVEREAPRASDAVGSLEDSAARRGTDPGRLRRALKGDLDNILAKALQKEPAARYPSVESLADDLRRYLNVEPVSARADSFVYRWAKFARRNRGGVAAAAIVAGSLVAGLAGVAWQAREARVQRDAAEAQLARATAASDFTSFLLSVAAPPGRSFTVGELLDQGETLIDRLFAHDDTLRAEMLVVIGQEYMINERYDRATPILERASAIAEASGNPELRARVRCPLAFLTMLNGERDKARAMIDRALADLPEAPRYDMLRAECLLRKGNFGYFDGDGNAMIQSSTAAIALFDRARAPTTIRSVDALGSLAYGYYLTRRNAEAERTFAEVMKGLEATGRDRTIAAADTLNNWALIYFLGDLARAEPLCRRVVELRRSIEGGASISPTATFNHAGTLIQLARYDEAIPLLEETIRVAAEREEYRIRFDAMMELAGLYIEMGDLARAADQLDTLTPHLANPRFDIFRQAQLAYYRGRLAQAQGDQSAARLQYSKAIEIFDSRKGKIAMNVRALLGLARSELALGSLPAAEAAVDKALGLAQSFVEKDAPSYLVGLSLLVRGELLASQEMASQARAAYQTALEHLDRTLGSAHPATEEARRRARS
ncbi:MAG TPA: protein kinase, partial [Candidatus Polarisedimenticolia bacterium]|nr:protein kinase [Candidatus Polarisedimenticolia bacterium]